MLTNPPIAPPYSAANVLLTTRNSCSASCDAVMRGRPSNLWLFSPHSPRILLSRPAHAARHLRSDAAALGAHIIRARFDAGEIVVPFSVGCGHAGGALGLAFQCDLDLRDHRARRVMHHAGKGGRGSLRGRACPDQAKRDDSDKINNGMCR